MPIKYRHEPDFTTSALLEFLASRQTAKRETDEINRRQDVARNAAFGDALAQGTRMGIGAGFQAARDKRFVDNQIRINEAESKGRIDEFLFKNFGIRSLEEASKAAAAGGQDVMTFLDQLRREQMRAKEAIEAQAEGKVFGIPPAEQSIVEELKQESAVLEGEMARGQLDEAGRASAMQRLTELRDQQERFQPRWFEPPQQGPKVQDIFDSGQARIEGGQLQFVNSKGELDTRDLPTDNQKPMISLKDYNELLSSARDILSERKGPDGKNLIPSAAEVQQEAENMLAGYKKLIARNSSAQPQSQPIVGPGAVLNQSVPQVGDETDLVAAKAEQAAGVPTAEIEQQAAALLDSVRNAQRKATEGFPPEIGPTYDAQTIDAALAYTKAISTRVSSRAQLTPDEIERLRYARRVLQDVYGATE